MVKILKKIDFEEFYKTNEYVANSSPMSSHYNSSNPIERWIWKQKKDYMKKTINSLPIKNIIDFGCGDGGILNIIKDDLNYVGIDISPTQIRLAKKQTKKLNKKNVSLQVGNVLELNFDDNSFDAAMACDVVEHVLSVKKIFEQLRRVVKKNGYILISIPNEKLWEIARGILLKFPLRSPDHISAIFPSDIYRHFPNVIEEKHIPINISSAFSLINIFLIKNVK
jgi:ubiquinone/menaquinone biosynthesis C-methylase UbiE